MLSQLIQSDETWERIAEDLQHPSGPNGALERGVLLRNRNTSIYVMRAHGGDVRSVPQRWARQVHELRETRQRLGLSLSAMAETLGVGRQTVWRWEHGVQEPPAYLWRALRDLERERAAS